MRGQTDVYDSYWRFAAERQSVLMKRLAGDSPPWTDDPVIRHYRFTNAYRATDRVSQYLIAEVIYNADRPDDPAEVFARVLLFKIFNRIETWELIERALGPVIWSKLDLNALSAVLDDAMGRGLSIYSAAYIMPSPPFGYGRKHENHIALLSKMMEEKFSTKIGKAKSLAAAYEMLLRWPGLGSFLAFQYCIDLNYSRVIDFDESDFVIAGPGALDGIAKCFPDLNRKSAEQIINDVCDAQEREFAARSIKFSYLNGRRLKPIDCQNLFCEISKYARVVHPEASGLLGRTRIKQSYRANPRPTAPLSLPPKWINGHD